MSDFAQGVDALSPAKRALFEKLLADKARGRAARPARAGRILPRPAGTELLPLSFAQQRLWFLDRLEIGNPAYHIPIAVRLVGELDVSLLHACLLTVIRRHEALRTTFEESAGRPFQVVSGEAVLPWREVDLRGLGPAVREDEMQRLIRDEARLPFDLRRGPLLRGLLLRLGEREQVLLLTIHHIVFDGWSTSLLIGELDALYRAGRPGAARDLPPVAVQYADFALWQREWLAGGEIEVQLAYWRRQLAAGDEALALPTDRPRPPVQTFVGAVCPSVLGAGLTRGLQAFARDEGTTLFVVLLAAFQALLQRYTGSPAIAVGTPIANRNHVETEGVIGFFVNTLVMRTEVAADLGFRALVGRVREVAIGAYAHQDLPFEKLVEALQPRRDLSRPPLFQVQLAFRNTPKASFSLPGLAVDLIPLDAGVTQFDLTLSMSEAGDTLPADIIYNVDLFDPTTAARMLGQLHNLFAAVGRMAEAGSDLRIADLPLLTEAETHQLLKEWNDTAAGHPGAPSLHALIEMQAARSPGAAAVVFAGASLTYAELDARANQLAHFLLQLGVGPESLVGVAVERSLDMVVGLLGILKAGAAYVPFDPNDPAERLAYMAADAEVKVLLTQERLTGRLPGQMARMVCLDTAWPEVARRPVTSPACPVGEDQLAYVIFTSGSTGRPKGAMNTHRGVCNRLLWMQEAFGLTAADRVLQKTPFSFDVSVWEFFWPLLTGARLVLAEPRGHLDPVYLSGLIAGQGITTVHFVPSMLAAFLEQDDLESRCRSLRLVIASGEALPPELVRRLSSRLGASLHNLYGPTEAAIDVTAWRCGAREAHGRVSIGRPIANLRTFVLDGGLRPVGIGVPGELFLGGTGVGRGYRGKPALTAERFVPDSLSGEPGARLYRTFDLARLRPDATLEFLGRTDHQVKIRGFRIELGEIETVLARSPEVQEAAVLARADGRGGRRLVAYVVPRPGAGPGWTGLRDFLRHELPEHMVPQEIVELPAMPLTASGKLDRKALPEPRGGPAAGPAGPAGPAPMARLPQSALERSIAAVWSEVLGVEHVDPEANFFDLGGHSLRLVEVQTRLRREIGADLSIVELFQVPTVRALTLAVQAKTQQSEAAVPVPRREASLPAASRQIAIIAMTGRFPGADSVEELWRNLRDGVESISFFSREEMRADGVAGALLDHPSWVPAWGALRGIELFDARFFGLSPREAEILDPQQRLFLECAWEVLERAGYESQSYPGRIGVYAGVGLSSYALNNLGSGGLLEAMGGFQAMIGNDKDYLATRTSYCLNLRGPSLSVQTACSTSLVAVSLACQSLLEGGCDMALAGGVSIRAQQRSGYLYVPGHIASPNGHCRAFAADAAGTVGGSGVGIVVLKRLDDALADGDSVHAVILGSALNNDGSFKVGYTAPSVRGQAEVIAAAQAAAGVSPAEISYVECHGTGTVLGDPIEVAGLTQAFAGTPLPPRSCALGSVKTNLGHLDAAAGVTGLIKTVLALEHREIPPSLHFSVPNPKIDFAAGPFFVNDRLRPWEAPQGRRLAGVSSFGIGGTNAHVVVAEAPEPVPSSPARPCQLLVLSARTSRGLDAATDNLARHLTAHPEAHLADVAFTLQAGRRAFEHRRALVVRSGIDAATVLAARDLRRLHSAVAKPGHGVAFLFPGQGAQTAGMAAELYNGEPVFRQEIDRCAELLTPHLVAPGEAAGEGAGRDLRQLLFADRTGAVGETWLTQPALFAVEHALARLWMSWGIVPQALLGHSVGEYVAACLAEVVSLEDALRLVAARGRVMQAAPRGAMLSVGLAAEAVLSRLDDSLSLAAVNAPDLSVVAGPEEAVVAFGEMLAAEGISCRRLRTSHAFHSALMEPVLGPFAREVGAVALHPPARRYLSNLTGTWITARQATDPGYWVEHLRRPVLFSQCLGELLRDPDLVLLEVGPGRSLTSLARKRTDASGRLILRSLRHPDEERGDPEVLTEAAGRLWAAGIELDWQGFHAGERRRRVVLPTYPFERRRYWISPGISPGISPVHPHATDLSGDGVRQADELIRQAGALLAGAEETGAGMTSLEREVGALWSEILGAEHLAAHDDFFELGGHSLLGIQLLSRLRDRFGVEIELDTLFQAPALGDFCAFLTARLETSAGTSASKSAGAPPLLPVPRTAGGAGLPLSFSQQRLWLIHQLEPESAVYNMPVAVRLEGALQVSALAHALAEIGRRHEVLRSRYVEAGGEPLQVLAENEPGRLPRVNLAGLPAGRREPAAEQLALAEAVRPFDLGRGPLLRALLLGLGEREHILVLTLHHIVTDAWSMGILVRELGALYESCAAALPSPLPSLPIQYADFAAWQRQWLQGEVLAGEIAFWRRQLAGLPPLLELPTDRPRPTVQSFRGATRPVRLPAGLTRQVETLARRQGATLFMVLLAAFQALLARLSGQGDLAVGSPIAGRNHSEIEGLIGFFVNTLVLRGNVNGEPAFRALVDRVRETALAAYLHQDLPFEKLVEELTPERSLARTPLFQVMLVLQNAPAGSLEIRDLRLRPVGVEGTTAKFDLTLALAETDGELTGHFEYATDLFDATTIDRLILHFERSLTAALAVPERTVSELPLLSVAELHQLAAEWNDTAVPLPGGAFLHSLFAAQAARTPEAPALVQGSERLTYGELDARADHLAVRLRALGAGPDVIVAVFLERSVELVLALLAVLKAGGAYLPLDVTQPRERLSFLLDDARAALLLTRTGLLPALPGHSVRKICLDDLPAAVSAVSVPQAEAGNLAYVLYTSGSTGRPKGVAVTHRGLTNYLLWAADAYGAGAFGSDERGAPVHSPVSFDLTVTSLFVPLLAGRCVVLIPEEAGIGGLAAALAEGGFGLAKLTPAHLELLQQMLPPAQVPGSASVLVIGGEPLTGESLAFWRSHAPDLRLMNEYGPTETVVGCCVYAVPVPAVPVGPVPIGRPIANTWIQILDSRLAPVPAGVTGELCIGGAGVCRGYLHRPALTAERLVPAPSGPAGERLYRTGDLARHLPDGSIEFLGRRDQQVKIRGFRIELGEVEAVLAAAPGVREAVVMAREDTPGDRRLVAYVRGDAAPGDLRRWLRERLPDYMVPAVFVPLAALPLTANGKVDRQALPAPERQSGGELFVAPRTPVEEVLAGIWATVLRLDRVGADGHFFALGGHSLLAAQVMSRLRGAFGVEMPLRELFEAPRLADLAVRIEAARRSGAMPPAPPLVAVSRQGPLPLSFAQQRLWLIDQLEPGSPLYNIPVALRVEGPLDGGVLARCLGEVVRRHESLRTVFAGRDGAPEQVILPGVPIGLPLVDLSGLPESRREEQALTLAGEEAGRPFDLVRGPLLRGVLLRLASAGGQMDHIIALTLHHITSDAWSAGILVREVAALYTAFAEGRPSPLPELPLQYTDFAAWQTTWLRGEVLEGEIAYWRRQLAGLPPLLELPTDRPRPAAQSYRGASVPVLLPVALTRQAAALARREGATLFMVLLAAFQAVLARHSGQDDLAVGSPVAGRNRVETEELIGFFVNTLVLRGDLAGEPTFGGLLGRTRETALAAYLHQDVPFEKLVHELAPERSLAHSPLFQVMLALQNAPVESLEIRDLRFRPVNGVGTTAKFDLTLSLGETAEGLAGAVEYAADLFDRPTVERFAGHLAHLLASAAAEPETSVPELRLMGVEEERQLLQGSVGRSRRTWALPVTVRDLLLESASRTPGRTAAIGPEGALTYGDLLERSRALAGRLQAVLPRPLDRPVALLADADPLVLAGMLGILQAGAGFVPLDPRHPDERLAWTLEDAACEVLVTQRRHVDRAEKFGLRHVLCLDDAVPSGAVPAVRDVSDPRALAYVVYTSGSTGRPKGVQISHENLVPMLLWGVDYLGLGASSRVLQSLNFCFDFGIFEHLTTLLAGGTLVFPGAAAGDPLAFAREIVRRGIDTLHTTPAFARELAATGVPLDGLKILHLGGEALTRDTVARLRQAAPRTALYNGYGPTEATVNSSIFRIGPEDSPWATVPIGRPSADNALYILDRAGRLVPRGVRGDLHVGGIGVARGYLNRPDLTAERFVPDPFGSAPGGRLYRTDDLVRSLTGGVAGGDIEFLGRLDHQVKIRGFRIELGEIEEALRTLPGVREAVVVASQDRGDPRLIAYVVGEAASGVLRSALRERLPEPMVPAVFVMLESLPITATGKVDRKALPAPERHHPEGDLPEEDWLAPRTPVEEVLAGIWAEVLGLERVGAADHFFALGGHSLLAARVMSRLRAAFGVELPLREIFEAPVLAGLAARVEAKQRMLCSGTIAPAPPLAPLPRQGPLPLSFAQQRLWFIDLLGPGSAVYNIPAVWHLTGPLDVAALAASLTALAMRHEVLRTTCMLAGGEPVQVVAASAEIPLPVVDLSGLPQAARRGALHRLAAEEARRPFSLERDLMLRAGLLRLGPAEHAALFTLHHIAADGWSLQIFQRELGAFYAGLRHGRTPRLPELPVQYADYSVWLRQWLSGSALAEEMAWWRDRLSALPPLLELPTDRPRPPVQSLRGASESMALPEGLARGLRMVARRGEATQLMVLLAAFEALLYRLTGQESFAVGTPIAGRTRVELEPLIGLFVNTLALPAQVTDESFSAHLARVREVFLDSHAHQEVPFERLVEELQPERSLSYSPVFQVTFAGQTFQSSAPEEELADLTLTVLDQGTGTAKYDLSLAIGEDGSELRASLEYACDLFDRTTARRLLEHLGQLLAAVAADPGRRIAELSLLTPAERQQLLGEWNDTSAAFPEGPPVHRLVSLRAAETPDAVAVEADGAVGIASLTYGELDRRANRLARRLRRLGVGPESRVGLVAPRGPGMVTGALAVLQAGGAYIPLDPHLPAERLAASVRDAAASVVLASGRWTVEPLPDVAAPIVDLDGDLINLETMEIMEMPEVTPDHGAYVIYTSGSTGTPKGVEIPHRGLLNLVLWHQRRYGVTAADRATLLASPSFDAAIWEMWPYLTAGATLCIPGDEVRSSPADLVRYLAARQVTLAFLVTPLAEAACEESWPARGALRGLLTGGAALQKLPPADFPYPLINHYGPTEGSVVATTDSVAPGGGSPPPIGRPMANFRAHVLDSSLALLPLGAPGELALGGAGLARGYLGRPEMTAEKFVPDPFGGFGQRLYRTGDLVRRLPDGVLRYLGRIDQQVKLRGFRVELGEIETVLASLPGVREAAVTLREERSGGPHLVAYVLPALPDLPPGAGAGMDVAALRDALRAKLPDYMVPADFVVLPELPRGPSGKVDRRSLPAVAAESRPAARRVPPRDELELTLLRIWTDVLGVADLGVTESFFDLGGHSLLSVKLLARIRERLGQALPLASLFEQGTIERQAALLRSAGGGAAPRAQEVLVALETGGPERPFFCVHPVGGNVLCYFELARRLVGRSGRPVWGFQSADQAPASIPEMADLYLAALREVQPEGPYLLGGWSMGSLVAFELACRLARDGHAPAALVLLDPPRPPGPGGELARDESLLAAFAHDLAGLSGTAESVAAPPERGVDSLDEPLRPLFTTFRRNVRAMESFRPSVYPGRIHLLLAEQGGVDQGTGQSADRGWSPLAAGGLEVASVPGNHYSMLREPHAGALAERLADLLAGAETARTTDPDRVRRTP